MTSSPGFTVATTLHSEGGTGVVRLTCPYETDADDLWGAITEPARLARWYGDVSGDLRVGGEFTALVHGSGWDGRGRVEECDRPRKLVVTMWEVEGSEHVTTAELLPDGSHTTLSLEVRGVPEDYVWAYGAGWHAHLESLGAHVAGEDPEECPGGEWPRWEELAPSYREMTVVPLER